MNDCSSNVILQIEVISLADSSKVAVVVEMVVVVLVEVVVVVVAVVEVRT